MRIGIDLDGVVFDIAIVIKETMKKLYDVDISPNHIFTYSVAYCFGLTPQEGERVIADFMARFPPLIPGAKEGIQKLSDDGHTIYIVTNRGQYSPLLKTINILRYYDIPYHYIIDNKYSMIDMDMMVDDNIDKLLDWGKDVKYKMLYIQPWNDRIQPLNSVIRVTHWNSLLRLVEMIEEGKIHV